ncbi:hypothetical protein LCGC14_0970990 [marine sediment metagenome]|uniref:Uncharacterized protein n=1 Tax=marine sediment metagenome TaxID=412755 RepID=A0A0F9QUW4_9ZZZZ
MIAGLVVTFGGMLLLVIQLVVIRYYIKENVPCSGRPLFGVLGSVACGIVIAGTGLVLLYAS